MADQSNLVDWLMGQSGKIDYKVTEFRWVDDYAPEYSDFGVNFYGDKFIGRAVDKDQNLALTKAIAEAIERATCSHNDLRSSTGVAAHTNLSEAIHNAKLELIERIAFDLHFANRISFQKVKPLAIEAKFAMQKTQLQGVQLNFYQLISPDNVKIICAVATGSTYVRPFGGIIGLGANESVVQAEKSALFECLRNLTYYLKDLGLTAISKSDFQCIDTPKFMDRFRLTLDSEYFREIGFLFLSSSLLAKPFPILNYEHRELELPPEFKTAPLMVAQVLSDYRFKSEQNALPSPVG